MKKIVFMGNCQGRRLQVFYEERFSPITGDTAEFIGIYDAYEHAFEQSPPHRGFRDCAGMALQRAMADVGLDCTDEDIGKLTDRIPRMPPFPETSSDANVLLSVPADRQ